MPATAQRRKPGRMQCLSVGTYVYFIPVLVALNLLCLCNRWTAVAWLLYTLYINVGPGRRACKTASWPKYLRKSSWWRPFAEYFPCQLIKTAELDPNERYIFVVAPHGILTMYAWPCFDTDACGFSSKFPGIEVHPMTLEVNFRLPFMREFLLAHGIVDASRAACLLTLGRGPGSSILLAVGGAQESLLSAPGTYDIILAKRKGFIKIALQTGAKLVPVIGFGENDLYDITPTLPGSARATVQRVLKRLFGFTLPNARGWGLGGFMPWPRPLTVVVGAPVTLDAAAALGSSSTGGGDGGSGGAANGGGDDGGDVMQRLVDAYHAQYVAALRRLWDEHKDAYDPGRRRSLDIVE